MGKKFKLRAKAAYSFHKYTFQAEDSGGKTRTYILRAAAPLESGPETAGEAEVDKRRVAEELLSSGRNVLNINLSEMNDSAVYITRAITSGGKVVDEVPLSMKDAAILLNRALKESGNISLKYEGTEDIPKKEFDVLSKTIEDSSEKTKRVYSRMA